MENGILDASLQGISFSLLRGSKKRRARVGATDTKTDSIPIHRQSTATNKYIQRPRHPRKLYYKGRSHIVDFVLVYRRSTVAATRGTKEKIIAFQNALRRKGLLVEVDQTPNRNEVYVKIHAPFSFLARYADVLKIKMPVPKKCCPKDEREISNPLRKILFKFLMATRLIKWFIPELDKFPRLRKGFGWPFSRTKEYLFDVPDPIDDFFSFNERSYIISYVLRHCKYGDDEFEYGIGKLLRDDVYTAAFCPHVGNWNSEWDNMRKLLYEHWAHPRNWCKLQPLDHIREYFGSEIGMYFAWLGQYLLFLLIATVFCSIFAIYSLVLAVTDPVTNEICTSGHNITMCPLCDTKCHFWRLSDACYWYRFAGLVNNENTLIYTTFMAVWGMLFLIYWQREQAALLYRWRLYESENSTLEAPRPEYTRYLAERARKGQRDEETSAQGQKTDLSKAKGVPFWRRRFPMAVATYSTILLLMAVAVALAVGVVAYRLSLYARLKLQREFFVYENAYYISSATAAALNLLIIVVMGAVYEYLAVWLTDQELRRTDSEYSDSLALKLYLLQFVNNYGSILYIAFLKGKFAGHPGDAALTSDAISGKIEECKIGGCLFEVTLQMVIVFIGKQVWNVLKDPLRLYLNNLYNLWRYGHIDRSGPFAKDLKLLELDNVQLIFENMEIMIQYGFMCFFIAAFPMAPLFVLIGTIIEIRCGAIKFVRFYRRPTAKPVKGIGIWYGILLAVTRISTFTNALLIALTSDFIPKMYLSITQPNGNFTTYVEFTLAYFNTSDFRTDYKNPFDPLQNTTICRYRQFRNPPWSDRPYQHSEDYWKLLAYKLLFIIIFENFLLGSTKVLKWIIPNKARYLQEKIRRKSSQVTEYMLQTEILLAKVAPCFHRWYRKGTNAAPPIHYMESNV